MAEEKQFISGGGLMYTYTRHMLLVGEVKVVHFLLKGVQYLPMSGHVGGQNEGDNCLESIGAKLETFP